MRAIGYRNLARQHRAKLLQSVACTVGAGKTVAVRAALAALDNSRHTVIYLPDPTIGVRGIYHHIVAALGGRPSFHNAALVPQTRDALAAEHDERGKVSILVLDEAHLLTRDALEALRLLTNHDMDSTSPFACHGNERGARSHPPTGGSVITLDVRAQAANRRSDCGASGDKSGNTAVDTDADTPGATRGVKAADTCRWPSRGACRDSIQTALRCLA